VLIGEPLARRRELEGRGTVRRVLLNKGKLLAKVSDELRHGDLLKFSNVGKEFHIIRKDELLKKN
jgi:hypothetical protein